MRAGRQRRLNFIGALPRSGGNRSSAPPRNETNPQTKSSRAGAREPFTRAQGAASAMNWPSPRVIAALKLGDACLYDQSCQYFDRNAVCARTEDGESHVCQCRPKYAPSVTLESVLADSICIPGTLEKRNAVRRSTVERPSLTRPVSRCRAARSVAQVGRADRDRARARHVDIHGPHLPRAEAVQSGPVRPGARLRQRSPAAARRRQRRQSVR